jgi:hypothetical protein
MHLILVLNIMPKHLVILIPFLLAACAVSLAEESSRTARHPAAENAIEVISPRDNCPLWRDPIRPLGATITYTGNTSHDEGFSITASTGNRPCDKNDLNKVITVVKDRGYPADIGEQFKTICICLP